MDILHNLIIEGLKGAAATPGNLSHGLANYLSKHNVYALPYPIGTEILTKSGFNDGEFHKGYITSYTVGANGINTFWVSFNNSICNEFLIDDIDTNIFIKYNGE